MPGRMPVPSRSEAEPLREAKFEEVNCMGELGTGLSDTSTTWMRHEAKGQRTAKSNKEKTHGTGDQRGTVKHVVQLDRDSS